MAGKKVTGQLSASQWHEKYPHFHLHPKQALFLDFSIVSMGARDLVSNPFPVYYLWPYCSPRHIIMRTTLL